MHILTMPTVSLPSVQRNWTSIQAEHDIKDIRIIMSSIRFSLNFVNTVTEI